jgi:hypothetical protein
VAGFAAAWVLAAGHGDLLDLSSEFGPDRFMVAYAVAGTVLASRRRSNPRRPAADTAVAGGRLGRGGTGRVLPGAHLADPGAGLDRARYDAERVVAGFSERLREQVNLDVLGADLIGVVRPVLAPENVSLWLRDQPDGQERAGADR